MRSDKDPPRGITLSFTECISLGRLLVCDLSAVLHYLGHRVLEHYRQSFERHFRSDNAGVKS